MSEEKKSVKITTRITDLSDKIKDKLHYDSGTFELKKEDIHGILPEDITPEQYDRVLSFLPDIAEATLLSFGNASIEKMVDDDSKELNSTIFKYEQPGLSISHSFTGKREYKNQLKGGVDDVSYGKVTSEVVISGGGDMKKIKNALKDYAERQFK